MDLYIGTKEVRAKEMTRGKFVEYTNGTGFREGESTEDEGYLVEYQDSPNSNHADHENYISWSPKDVFDIGYTQIRNSTLHHSSVQSLLSFFKYDHLPPHLQAVSKPFCRMAYLIAEGPSNPETTTALRKLLESKDCAVRALL